MHQTGESLKETFLKLKTFVVWISIKDAAVFFDRSKTDYCECCLKLKKYCAFSETRLCPSGLFLKSSKN